MSDLTADEMAELKKLREALDKKRAASRKWRKNNPEKIRAAKRNWRENNLEKSRAIVAKSHAKRAAAFRRYKETLCLIATPCRPDGTWNYDREAVRQLAEKALKG